VNLNADVTYCTKNAGLIASQSKKWSGVWGPMSDIKSKIDEYTRVYNAYQHYYSKSILACGFAPSDFHYNTVLYHQYVTAVNQATEAATRRDATVFNVLQQKKDEYSALQQKIKECQALHYLLTSKCAPLLKELDSKGQEQTDLYKKASYLTFPGAEPEQADLRAKVDKVNSFDKHNLECELYWKSPGEDLPELKYRQTPADFAISLCGSGPAWRWANECQH